MKEEFLHYTWKTKQFSPVRLKTTDGQFIEILHPGDHNLDAGPDFFNAKLKIDGMIWSGNVEIHVKASDWLKHRHQHDAAYDNVILHVVHEADVPLKTNDGRPMPTLVLKKRLDNLLYIKYLRLRNSKESIPCSRRLQDVPHIIIESWLARLLAERLERKVGVLKKELENNGNNWEEIFYRHLARQFGMKVNAEPFQWLAAALPWRILARQHDNLLQSEALLFGQSGLLPEKMGDVYTNALIREYTHLQGKYSIRPMPSHRWKFMRLRPNNFPTLRIAQLAGLFYRQPQLFRRCMETEDIRSLRKLLDVPASGYWSTHYRFGKPSKRSEKHLGPQAIDTIIVNTILPFKFLYGEMQNLPFMKENALELLEKLNAEDNVIIRAWKELGVKPASAAETQALTELTRNYCGKRKCLQCAIGQVVMERERVSSMQTT